MDLTILNTPFFGIIITIFAFNLGLYILKKSNLAILNPLLIGTIIIMSVISYFEIPLDYYKKGGDMMSFFLAPATIALALPLYRQLNKLKMYYIPILIGGIVGACSAILSVIFIGKLLGLNNVILKSFVPKSITTPLGIELSQVLGGIPAITIFAIIVTGITGNILAPVMCKIFRIKHPIAKGLGIGISSHAVGTAKALEMGEVEGGMSSLSIVIAGILTFIIAPFLIFLV
ncbi:LrgB family protein [Fusobacterium sp. IOR10]|uniref:LrgB family protein n=1 Tax=Fusobacterium sp. IOR10 TaxID=2665157 RepID=UPI0013D19CEB|nr:LrgB family protein [Fusobacterium sp. IOR10]